MSIQAILYARGNEVVTISPGAPAAEAAEMLAVHNIAALAVVEAGAILGFVSGHEIVQAWSRHHHDLSAVTVMDILDPGVVSVSPDDSLKRVMTLFVRHPIRHVAVLRDGKLDQRRRCCQAADRGFRAESAQQRGGGFANRRRRVAIGGSAPVQECSLLPFPKAASAHQDRSPCRNPALS